MKCECGSTGVIRLSTGNEIYCTKHKALRKWPRLTKDGDIEFIWMKTGKVVDKRKDESPIVFIS